MPTEDLPAPSRAGAAPGALLLCRADPDSVAPAAHLLREPLLLSSAGHDWSVLVPEGTPWQRGTEPVDRVLTGWATALAVGASAPVLALWWDADRAGCTLASGFRRTVAYVWLADGTPVGEDEAMRTFAARLGLDPVLDAQSLQPLTQPDSGADARARLHALLAVLTRAGVTLPAGVTPGDPASRLREAARAHSGTREIQWPVRREPAGTGSDEPVRTGSDEPVRTEPDEPSRNEQTRIEPDAPAPRSDRRTLTTNHPNPWIPWSTAPRPRAVALAQMSAGLPLTVWGLRRRSGGWAVAGAVLLAHGTLALTYDLTHPPD